MQLKLGTYSFPANATIVGLRRSVNDPKNPTELTKQWDVQANITASGQSACATALTALESACDRSGVDAVFYRDDGGIAMRLPAATALSGPTVINMQTGTQNTGYEWVNGLSVTLTITATYPMGAQGGGGGSGIQLLTWSETISRTGDGKARWGHIETVNAKPLRVMLKAFSLFRAVQSGQATALLGYPIAPGPLWSPTLFSGDPQIEQSSPQQPGEPFRVTWNYQYESANPLLGLPSFGRF